MGTLPGILAIAIVVYSVPGSHHGPPRNTSWGDWLVLGSPIVGAVVGYLAGRYLGRLWEWMQR